MVDADLGCGYCGIIGVSGFNIQSVINKTYIKREGEQVWESDTHTIEYGVISEAGWEILLKPGGTGASRPALCKDAAQSLESGPLTCSEWAEWHGYPPGFVTVDAVLGCR
jgi:hypothetical protein